MRPISPVRRSNEGGQAILILVTALTLVLILAVGWGIDSGRLYSQRQEAQAAADAGAQAGIMTMYDATASLGTSTFTCTSGSTLSPCYYVAKNGFGTSNDTTTVSFPTSVSGVSNLWSSSSAITVRVQRSAGLTLMRVMGLGSATISASATAAIVASPSPAPIVVTHPTLQNSLSDGGASTIIICGGPNRAIVVNSDGSKNSSGGTGSGVAYSLSSVDLSHAGPLDPGNCTSGTGADFASVGTGNPANISLGTTGHYVQPASPAADPLANLSEPVQPTTLRTGPTSNAGSGSPLAAGCATTCTGGKGCDIYQPGHYPTGIQVKNTLATFYPGLYYLDATDTNGFSNAANGDSQMMPSACVTADPDTGNGMVVFNAGSGNFSFGANANTSLTGAPITSTKYEGVLFFQGRSIDGVTHTLGGGGSLTLIGTIYLNKSAATYNNYNRVNLGGGSGSGTQIQGQIITNAITLSGNASIQMNLSGATIPTQRQVALIR
jgi:hypothetical protein